MTQLTTITAEEWLDALRNARVEADDQELAGATREELQTALGWGKKRTFVHIKALIAEGKMIATYIPRKGMHGWSRVKGYEFVLPS